MKRFAAVLPTLFLLVVAVPANAHQPWNDTGYNQLPNLNGPWFMNGDRDKPCYVMQDPDGSAVFINENGSRAAGQVYPDRVWIPKWSPGHGIRGLEGRIRGDMIIWPDGNLWSR